MLSRMRLRTFLLVPLLLGLLPGHAAASPEDQHAPAVAFDGRQYLVVWHDRRQAGSDVYAARVDTAGTVLDPAGIAVSTASGVQRNAAVAFDGANFLVVWEDGRSRATGPDVYAARVSPEGAVLDPGGFPVSAAPAAESSPAVARTGTGVLVAWGSGSDIRGARLSPAGAVADPLGIAISTAPGPQREPALAFDGANALVAWEDGRAGAAPDVYAARVSAAGAVLDPGGVAVAAAPGAETSPAVSSAGSGGFLVAWTSGAAGGSDVSAARVGAGGAVLAPGTIAVAADPGEQAAPALAFGGSGYLVAWQHARLATRDLHAARISSTGAVLDAAGIAVSTAGGRQHAPAVSFGTGEFLVAWEDGRAVGGGTDVFAARVNQSGALLDRGGIALPAPRDTVRPQTRITTGTGGRTRTGSAAFAFVSSEAGSTFHCKLDRRAWRPCRSPQRYRRLGHGRHVFQVRARDRAGNLDATPAGRRWRVGAPVPGLLRVVPGSTRRSGPGRLVRYQVQVEDGIPIDPRAVAETVDAILADRRSWGRTGRVAFQRVPSGPVSFRVVLVTPGTADRLCLPLRTGGIYSCAMHGRAVLNLMRWRRGAPAFRGDMTMYRRYLVNHEVGHLLGHGHRSCHRAGAPAPVMMQQTKGVGACRANAWPLPWERA
jgi:Protein of unknown function (DUF3152)